MQMHPSAEYVLRQLNMRGFEAFIVGGCVRDMLRGEIPHDWDITTNALPEEMQAVFANDRLILTGLQHGTLTVVVDDLPIEVTTYRVDGSYSDHRHPDQVVFSPSLQEDLARRDFTINAMAYHPETGLVDPFLGQKDLSDGIIRCVGDPLRRFDEDALRIMRALRFASTLSFAIHPDTADALHKMASLLNTVAAERIYHELKRMICGDGIAAVMTDYPDVLAQIIPEITAMQACEQRHPCHDGDVYAHTVKTVAAADKDAILRLTMLFHDAGKPLCRTTDEDGCDHFYGHPKLSAKLAVDRLSALKAERHTIDTVEKLILHHDCRFPITKPLIKRWLNRLGEENFIRLIAVQKADTAGLVPAIARERLPEFEQMEALLSQVLQEDSCFSLKQLAVNGRDLMALGINGKTVGDWLDRLLSEVIEERLANDKQVLLDYVLSKQAESEEKI